jgi:hypothetical protein
MWKEKDAFPMTPSSIWYIRRVRPMSISDVLTLILVIFAALSYIDSHTKK